MNWWLEIVFQAGRNVAAHRLRSGLTMFGIAWGVASIMFMMAIGDGFKRGYRDMLYAMGRDIVILWGGRTTRQAGDQRAGRRIQLRAEDAEVIQRDCPLVRAVTRELDRNLRVSSRFNSGRFSVNGVDTVYQEIRSLTLAAGRRLNEADSLEGRAVCLLGDKVRRQLFADRPAVGGEVRIQGVPFLVVGELAEKDQNNSYNGLDGNKVVIPFAAMARHFPDPRPFVGEGAIDNLIFSPVHPDDHDAAVRQVRAALGRVHRFEPDDRGALWMWDTVQQARMVDRIYDSMQIFLSVVAVVTLALGGVGVMNIMLVAIAERTREIGIKQATGATPNRILAEFFLEALLLTLVSGAAGGVFAWGVSSLVGRLPLPKLFAGLPMGWGTASLAFGTLVLVGILAALIPARRASRLTPVEALRFE